MRIFLTPVFSSSSAGMLRIQFRVENDEQMSSELRNRLNEKRKTQNAGGNFFVSFLLRGGASVVYRFFLTLKNARLLNI